MKVDAIVNTANPEPIFSRGTDGALYRAAGAEKLLAARKKIGRIPVGEAWLTPAFGLSAKYIIHTVGPAWQGGGHGEADALRRCYKNSLELARKQGCESIAFPLLSTGAYGFPREEALQIALSEIGAFVEKEDMMVWLVVFDRESFVLSETLFADIDAYIDSHYVEARMAKEYGAPCAAAASLPPAGKGIFAKRKKSKGKLHENEDAAAFSGNAPTKEPCAVPAFLERSLPVQERSLEDVVAQLGETFQQRLFRLIDERSLTDVEVYKRANLDRKLFSKIRCNADYRPKKMTAVALAVALKLNLDETKDLLSRAEMALSPSSKFDLIITYFIEREVYDIYTINAALFQHGQQLLGA